MTAVTIPDLNNAKTDLDHIATVANSTALTATDRMGHTKDTVAGAIYKIAGITNRGAWATATAYATKDIVLQGGVWYVAVVAHTSSAAFATDSASKWRVYQGVTSGDLSATTGAALVGTSQAGTGAVLRTAQDKLREIVSVKDFGAVGNGVADDTSKVHAAITYAKGIGAAVFFPAGVYRVTSGYTQTVIRANLALVGPTRSTSDIGDNLGAIILLDSTDPASFFFDQANSAHLYVGNLRFRSAQLVPDRAMFKFSASSVNHRFHSVAFDNVDRPVVYGAACYFQSSSLIDVQFNNSGTIYSDSNATSIGNLLTLINVSHDGTIPANTAKIVCDLQGIRGIQGSNFLLEGTLPSTGWTVLRLDNDYDGDWTQFPMAEFHGFWSEWTVNAPTYVVDQKGGRAVFSSAYFDGKVYKLTQGGQVTVKATSFIGEATTQTLESMFSFEDYKCHAVLEQCTARYMDTKASDRITFRDCVFSADGARPFVTAAQFGTSQSSLAAKWGGGYFDGDNLALLTAGGTTGTPSTDATYGRKYVFTPSGNSLSAQVFLKLRGLIALGVQFNIVALVKLPVFTGGSFTITPLEQASSVLGGAGYDTTYSGQTIKVNIAVVGQGVATTVVGLQILSGATGVAGNCELYSLAFYLGNDMPRVEYPNYPKNIITYNTAAPVAGGWVQGDRVINSAPAVGSPKAWTCTVTGTPGTWVSEGNL